MLALQNVRPVSIRMSATTMASSDSADGRVLVTFDVDGTLVKAVGERSNRLHKRAFSHAFKEVFGVEGHIDVIQHHGSTDQLVARDVLQYYGISPEESMRRMPEIVSSMVSYSEQHATEAGDGLQVLPGVKELLQVLQTPSDPTLEGRIIVGLVTGNLEPIAWLKMDAVGLLQHFTVPRIGGFGSDATDRGRLVVMAKKRAEREIPGPAIRKHLHVGDTPNDIKAAIFADATAVGVLTGIFKREDLLGAVPSNDMSAHSKNVVILNTLEDAGRFLDLLALH